MDSIKAYNPFAPKKTPKELAKEAKRETRREVRGAQRGMDREMRELDRQEKQITQELKQRAKLTNNGKDPALAALAKQLVQTRKQREKIMTAKAQIGAVGMNATAMATQVSAAAAIGSVSDAMKTTNKAMNVKDTMKILQEFQKENERMEVKQELMDDALMDAFDNEEVEEEAELVTNQVLAELGVEMDSKMVGLNAPSKTLAVEEQEALEDLLPDLRSRLDAL
mmetsp:Transcript_18841/g.46770  ORF Transcript_18841/g.46770 Transcript_18841/m.46770 type:complete len:224 (-) Transcript_18841:160-831(-)|eukprot:CAMPEP_0116092408 /NCGR_PEP_ID=MMETSP0327-20121206/8030_1 /TAXON_ID=44447 /ORGANISM="Pseudo-nitzschia delicatissima, Strain B596" /LENGTH=223 /DNA_ID=CAMNT_0003583839 /DNA_START=219 /DNA_END=890 /DNA_ORIENTATION=+